MIKSWTRDITLAIQTRTGVSSALLIWAAVMALAALMVFVFLCVTLYQWLSLQLDSVMAGLATAGVFLAIVAIAVIVCASVRRRARERAILERAARARASSWLFDPKILGAALQAGRTLGWQRLVPIALLGFIAAQWAREHRRAGDASANSGD
jgi:hypothetical protein